jgi:hypothetical protein
MEARWGFQKAWVPSAFPSLYEDFAPFSAGALMQALNEWYRFGNAFAPKPSQLLKATADVARLRLAAGIDGLEAIPCVEHRWADPSPFDEDRHLTCVLCGEQGGLTTCKHVFNDTGYCVYCPHRVKAAAS